jgi:hypothetical protein
MRCGWCRRCCGGIWVSDSSLPPRTWRRCARSRPERPRRTFTAKIVFLRHSLADHTDTLIQMVDRRVSRIPVMGTREQEGFTSRNGFLPTIAAMHNHINQVLATPTKLHNDSRNGVVSGCKEINRLAGLGVRDDPNLELTPGSK